MQSPHSTGSSKLQRCTKAVSHIVDGVESDKKLRGENSLGERRINLSYWKWNRYQEIIFGLNCIASLNSFKSGGGCSGGGCVGRSCSSCVSHSGCICSRDSVAGMELFWLSKIFLLLGRVIIFKKAFSLHLHFWQLFLPELLCLSLGCSSEAFSGVNPPANSTSDRGWLPAVDLGLEEETQSSFVEDFESGHFGTIPIQT